jgi:hypothetical protein
MFALLLGAFLGAGAFAQQATAKQNTEALSILRDVVVHGQSSSEAKTPSLIMSGIITKWHKNEQSAPFTLQVEERKTYFSAMLPDGKVQYHSTERSSIRTAKDGSKGYATKTRHRLWLYPNSSISDLINDPEMNISLISQGQASGAHVAIVAVKDVQYGSLATSNEMRDKFALYFEINTDSHNILAVTDCSVPIDAILTKECVMHRIEYSDYQMNQNVLVPHKITEMIGLMPVNVFTINTVRFGQ